MPIPTQEQRLAVREYPNQNPIMDQKWRNLLFLHWEYEAAEIQAILPPGLTVDTFEGKAYVTITPFTIEGVKPKFFPSIPGLSNFSELNVRTYVYDASGTPGVWFFSLDANQFLAVQMARQFFSLPYRYSNIDAQLDANGVMTYSCKPEGAQFRSDFIYYGSGNTYQADINSLEFFLIERYVLFVNQVNQIRKVRVYHEPYPLKQAHVEKFDARLFETNGLKNPSTPPNLISFSPGVDIEVFPIV